MEEQHKRAKILSVKAVVEYSDGKQKEVDVDVNEYEALFWSEQAVLEVLAPFYEKNRAYEKSDLEELSKDIGKDLSLITPDDVKALWNMSVDEKDEGDRPILIKKQRTCIPTVACKRCY